MQRKKIVKVNPFPGYVRISEPDKEELARLTALAKGKSRSLRDFASACGVNTSTLSRIINVKSDTDTPNSDSLIAAIAENADPNSGVTLEMLLDAHGIAPIVLETSEIRGNKSSVVISLNKTVSKNDILTETNKLNGNRNTTVRESLCREILQNALLSRGYDVSVELRKNIVTCADKLRYVADFVFETNALEKDNITTWGFDVHNAAMRPLLYKLSWVFGVSYLDSLQNKGMKFSIITTEKNAFEDVKERFASIRIPDAISVIYIDINNRKIVDEYVIPNECNCGSFFRKEGESI